ncbi:MAG TPA: hypothetical protein P5567_13715 [Kiritimatiellia bacterium]|nr:hypothetical protein [Kiritimatiellia bacterium]HRZ13499.1 hypothetical protein [Kiritimatiellia bacterium]HSA19196.1 hypothetical protein [Kiritimatiellia bacterium]
MKAVLRGLGVAAGLVLLPLIGVKIRGYPVTRYLEFPPLTRYVEHAGFSWPAFVVLTLLGLALVVPMVRVLVRAWADRPRSKPARPFPAWGWFGVVFTAAAWVLAWNRFPWFAPLQRFTFTPLWLGYIVLVNALAYRRTGACMMTARPRFFLALFPVSAVFWWYFEYLNRFVQNWYYTGVEHISPLQYFIEATLPFSTVLPAVLGTCEFLGSVFGRRPAASEPSSGRPAPAVLLLAVAALGLAFLAVWPDMLFPLLWISPLLVLSAMRMLSDRPFLDPGPDGSAARRAALFAASALICGFFWEMWNFHSLARWVYAVPFVNRFHLFEMPLLGFAGYLPFGLECALIGDAVGAWIRKNDE